MFLMPFTDFVAGDTKTPMLVLLVAVGFVLLIACSNIAGLMLARASGRSREIAVRAALGAGRWDLIRQSLAESLVLVFGGAIVGLGLAFAGVRGLLALAPEGLPVAVSVRMDATVLLFTVLAAIAAGILFGIAPAWQISRLEHYELLKEGGRANTGGLGRQHLRASLVVAEVALALVLLVGAGLFLRSLAALQDVQPGFQSNGVITAALTLPTRPMPTPASASPSIARFSAIWRPCRGGRGAAATPVPFDGGTLRLPFIEGRPSPPGDPGPHGDIGFVSPDYFATLKIPVRKGRVFSDADRKDTQAVAMIDEILARQYWPNEDPIGKHMRFGHQCRGPRSSAWWAT